MKGTLTIVSFGPFHVEFECASAVSHVSVGSEPKRGTVGGQEKPASNEIENMIRGASKGPRGFAQEGFCIPLPRKRVQQRICVQIPYCRT